MFLILSLFVMFVLLFTFKTQERFSVSLCKQHNLYKNLRDYIDSNYKNPEIYKKNVMPIKGVKGQQFYFADGSDSLFNQGFKFSIQHVPSGQKIEFKAFITAFNDSYSQDWNSEPVYGRADPLYNFKQTTRKISFAFKMPAASEGEAYANLAKAQKLAQFMYPNYTDVSGAKVLSQAPLLRLKIMN